MASYELATKAEILAIFQRSTALLDRLLDHDDEDDDFDLAQHKEHRRVVRYVGEALRFCAVAAEALRDPSLGDVVMEGVRRVEDFDDYADSHPRTIHHALSVLLKAGLPADKRIRKFAKHSHAGLREAVARGLDPHGKTERLLLENLASDPVAAVRQAAQKSLAAVAEVPWWTGKWKTDPTLRLLPGEQEACGPALRRTSEILDLSHYEVLHKETNLAELCAELQKLPDDLAIEAIEQFCRAAERYAMESVAPLLLLLFERRDGLAALERLIDHWGRSDAGMSHEGSLAKIVIAAPGPTRLAICQRLVALVVAAPPADRSEIGESPAWLAASVVGSAWPPDADITPLLDVVLALDGEELADDERDYARSQLADAFGLEGVDPAPVLERLVEARVNGYPHPWAGIGHKVEPLLERAPPDVLRRTAERALQSEDEATIRWSLKHLLGATFDPGADGEPLDRMRAVLAEPRLRKVVLGDSDLTDRALAVLRSELRGGTLSYPEAVHTLEAIARLYGGLADAGVTIGLLRMNRTELEQIEANRREHQEATGPFLGPPELHGPPSEAEWEALRQSRAAFAPDDLEGSANLWMRTLSAGNWTAEEGAVLATFVALFREGRTDDLAFALGSALASKPDAELLPLFDEIVIGADRHTRPLLKRFRAETRVALGLAPMKPKDGAAGATPDVEANDDLPGGAWDDESDDDESDDDESDDDESDDE